MPYHLIKELIIDSAELACPEKTLTPQERVIGFIKREK
jgi:hypothetical protein